MRGSLGSARRSAETAKIALLLSVVRRLDELWKHAQKADGFLCAGNAPLQY